MATLGCIRVGIGGWDYAPWRETFYPADVPQKRQLEYASRQVTTIEVNGTFYRLQTPAVFAKWHDETPENFVFSLKASRFITNRRVLASAGESIQRFIDSGITQLRAKLGPILWQLAPTTQFDAADVEAFLKLLPDEADGIRLRHALEVRHESFVQAPFVELARRHNTAIVLADSKKYPAIPDATADFVYARLMNAVSSEVTGYERKILAMWAQRAQSWASGQVPQNLPVISAEPTPGQQTYRDVFMYVINGAKERAPAAAMQLLACLGGTSETAPASTTNAAVKPRKTASKKSTPVSKSRRAATSKARV